MTTRPHSRPQGFVLVTALIFLLVLSMLGVAAVRSSLFEERLSGNDTDLAFARENAELALRDAERDILGIRFDSTGNTPATRKFCAEVACTHQRPADTRPTSDAPETFWSALSLDLDFVAVEVDDLPATTDPLRLGMYNASNGELAEACTPLPPAAQIPVWSGADWQDGRSRPCAGTGPNALAQMIPTVPYGYFTDAPFLMAQQGVPLPRYLIEVFRLSELPGSNNNKFSHKLLFRITAVGFGRNAGAGAGNARSSVTLQSVFSPS